jgi:hypothetical protein
MKNIKRFNALYSIPPILQTQLDLSKGSPEHPIYHPEGTLDVHIDIVVGRAMERPEKELHIAAILHDITKCGFCPALWSGKIGRVKRIPEGSYWQNVKHAEQGGEFAEIPEIKRWIKSTGADFKKVKMIVTNHMKMKSYLGGEKGLKGGMKESKRSAMKSKLSPVWDMLYYFSTYCDNMRIHIKP